MKPRYICVPHFIDDLGRAHLVIGQPHTSGHIDKGEEVITSKVLHVNFVRREIETKNSIYHWE